MTLRYLKIKWIEHVLFGPIFDHYDQLSVIGKLGRKSFLKLKEIMWLSSTYYFLYMTNLAYFDCHPKIYKDR